MTDSAIAFIWSALSTSPRRTTTPFSALTEMRPLPEPPRTSLSTLWASVASSRSLTWSTG